MIGELAGALGLGLGLGVVTGLPLGVVNVAVVATAGRDGARAGTWLGLGGALADTTHATVAFAGLGPVIAARPRLAEALAIASGVLLLIVAAYLARPRRAPASAAAEVDRAGRPHRGLLGSVAAGAALTLPNPGALAAWVAVAAALGPHRSVAAAVVTALGVGAGSALYFAGLARLAARSARHLVRPRWLDRGAALVIAVVGLVALARALWPR